MKYFLAQSIMAEPLPVPAEDVPKLYIPMHEKHIAAGIAAGMVLLAGPKVTEGGGLMIARAESREALDAFLAHDPFVLNDADEELVITEAVPMEAPCDADGGMTCDSHDC